LFPCIPFTSILEERLHPQESFDVRLHIGRRGQAPVIAEGPAPVRHPGPVYRLPEAVQRQVPLKELLMLLLQHPEDVPGVHEAGQREREQRGPGDFFPDSKGDARQSGGMRFRFASLCDMAMLKKAFDEAERVLSNDRTLSLPENRGANRYMQRLFFRLRNT